ncbi:fimbrillin family protein [Parabacteroides timonensis]|uniref:fimbrillin family protein n=1 Tax=Parabacteroides timonensis TaxID=1871013 RepID=UPI00094F1A32|nr:fimbrillin family protein [Parabacteroides timonensis]
MQKYILIIYSIICYSLLGCTDEPWAEKRNPGQNEGVPVEFVMELPQRTLLTRTGEEGGSSIEFDEKVAFKDGDKIQIIANFYGKTENDPGVKSGKFISSVCCFLEYNQEGDKWVNNSGEVLCWPLDSESAVFAAFYYPGFDGMLRMNEATLPVSLDTLTIQSDPLMTKEVTVNEYGHAVSLKFEHKCTRLVLTDVGDFLNTGYIPDKLWLTSEIANPNGDKEPLTNTFQLMAVGTEGGAQSFKFAFTEELVASPSTREESGNNTDKTSITVRGNQIASTTRDTEGTKGQDAIVFFLPPGDYSTATLSLRPGRPLLSWKDVNASTCGEGLQKLEAGKSYVVSMNDLGGHITMDGDADDWEQDGDDVVKLNSFELQEFLNAISAGKEYSCQIGEDEKETQLLDVIDNEVVLLKCIDFANQEFNPVALEMGRSFDGNKHYFKNIKDKPVFSIIRGATVKNLGLEEVQLYETVEQDDGINSIGALAFKSKSSTIEGIRLENINVNLTSDLPNGEVAIGALVGNSSDTHISEITVGKITVSITGKEQDPGTSSTLMLGGLIGQNAGGENGSLRGVSMLDGESIITVENGMKVSSGHNYTGGLVGLSWCSIENCKIRAGVDASEADGVWNYTGGLAGVMRGHHLGATGGDEHIHIEIKDSQYDGNVHGGICHAYLGGSSSIGHSSTGSLIGYSLGANTSSCTAQGEVNSTIGEQTGSSQTYYTIGGAFGCIRHENKDTDVDVNNNRVYVRVNNGINPIDDFCIVGWLAGVAPDEVKEKNNTIEISTTLNMVGEEDESVPDAGDLNYIK